MQWPRILGCIYVFPTDHDLKINCSVLKRNSVFKVDEHNVPECFSFMHFLFRNFYPLENLHGVASHTLWPKDTALSANYAPRSSLDVFVHKNNYLVECTLQTKLED